MEVLAYGIYTWKTDLMSFTMSKNFTIFKDLKKDLGVQ